MAVVEAEEVQQLQVACQAIHNPPAAHHLAADTPTSAAYQASAQTATHNTAGTSLPYEPDLAFETDQTGVVVVHIPDDDVVVVDYDHSHL